MKAPQFAYAKPASIADVFSLLEQHGDDAKLLAGGQSLVATLNMRLSSPSILIDLTALTHLRGIAIVGGALRIGALTTHRDIERSPLVAEHAPLLAQAVPNIAHVAIRNSGTIGGSLAFADPAAEWPACMLALDASFTLSAANGERKVRARDFFEGLYSTALAPGEMITAIEIPLAVGYRSVFLELARRHGDYAIAGIAAVARVASGSVSDLRLAYLGVGATPVLARHAMAATEGRFDIKAAQDALTKDLDPIADLYSSVPMKLHLARVLTGRALNALVA